MPGIFRRAASFAKHLIDALASRIYLTREGLDMCKLRSHTNKIRVTYENQKHGNLKLNTDRLLSCDSQLRGISPCGTKQLTVSRRSCGPHLTRLGLVSRNIMTQRR